MGGKHARKHFKIDELSSELKKIVEEMILTKTTTYAEIVQMLADEGFGISAQAVANYAKHFLKSREALEISNHNLKIIKEDLERYPDLDCTEALINILANGFFNKISTLKKEDFDEIDLEDLLVNINQLIRVSSQKRKADVQIKDLYERGFEEAKNLIFASLSKDKPELYQELVSYLNQKKDEIKGSGDAD